MDTQKESVRFLEFSDGSDPITYLKDHSADMIFLDIFYESDEWNRNRQGTAQSRLQRSA